MTKKETNSTYFVFQRSKHVGSEAGEAVPPQGPAFTLKAGLVPRPGLPLAVDSQMPPLPGTPRVHRSPEAEPGQGSPGGSGARRPLGATWQRAVSTHARTPSRHPGAGPPADNRPDECPETRASDILRFKVGKCIKTRTTQSAVSCATHFLTLNVFPKPAFFNQE